MLSVTLLTWVLEWKRKRCRYRQGSGSHTILLVYFNGTCASSVSACVHLRKQSVPSFTLCLQTAMHFSSAMKTWNSWDLHNSFQQNLKISVSIQILADIISERELLLGSNEPSGDRHFSLPWHKATEGLGAWLNVWLGWIFRIAKPEQKCWKATQWRDCFGSDRKSVV